MKKYLILLLLSAFSLQAETAQELTQKLIKKLDKVENYKVDATITIDVEFIDIEPRNATITYKKPDEFNIESDGFAMLPKNGAQNEYMTILRGDYTAVDLGTEKVNGKNLRHVKIIPGNYDGDIILAEMWIDETKLRAEKLEAFTKKNGSYIVNFEFNGNKYDLPSKLIVTFDLKNFQIPAQVTGEMEALGKKKGKEETTGKVIIDYKNYKVNK